MRTILCPVDFSEHSRRALRWAVAIARYRTTEVTVLSVVEPLLAEAASIRLGVDLAASDAEPALREFVEATIPEPARLASRLRMQVALGSPSEAILGAARRMQPGLIVMGTHGLGGFRKLLLGSTTESVLRLTQWPVLSVPAGAGSAPDVSDPGVQLKRILAATDFRDTAIAATRWAAGLAASVAVPLVLAHVVEPVLVSALWAPLVDDFDNEQVAAAQRALARLSAGLAGTRTQLVVSIGQPADTIASLALEHDAGLVVLGLANGRGTDSREPGSVAYSVLRTARAAVAVVPGLEVQATPGLDVSDDSRLFARSASGLTARWRSPHLPDEWSRES